MQKIYITAIFSKVALMRYISHLDFVRLIYRALRRTELPYVLTCGFNQRPKIKFGAALKLGKEGIMETKFFLSKKIELEDFKNQMEKQLTEGIRIIGLNYGE